MAFKIGGVLINEFIQNPAAIQNQNIPLDTNNETHKKFGSKTTQKTQLKDFSSTSHAIQDKLESSQLLGSYNRQRTEKLFAQQQQEQDKNKEINGVTTKTDFTMPVGEGETQESVLRRTYQEMARRAGLSDEKKSVTIDGKDRQTSNAEIFVEKSLQTNREAVKKAATKDENRIFNSETGKVYSDTDFNKFRTGGSIIAGGGGQIVMNPTDSDIERLKTIKSTQDWEAGRKAADEINKALELGDRNAVGKLFSNVDASIELGKALEKVKANEGNADFQTGLLNRLGADKVVKLEGMLNDNKNYGDLMRKSLSTVSQVEPDSTVAKEVAKKASIEQLVRLTGDQSTPMSKDFLVEAGKNAIKTKVVSDGIETPIYSFDIKATEILRNISNNKQASVELLQDKEFIKQGFTISMQNDRNNGFNAILRSGTSKEAVQFNSNQVDIALKNISEVLKTPDQFRLTNERIIGDPITGPNDKRLDKRTVSEDTAITLAEIYKNNSPAFSEAVSYGNSGDTLDKNGVKAVFSAINQYESSQETAIQATSEEIGRLLLEKPFAESNLDQKKAGNLIGVFSDTDSRTTLKNAKDNDSQQDAAAKVLEGLSDIMFSDKLEKGLLIPTVTAKSIGKTTAQVVGNNIKGKNVEHAKVELDKKYDDMQDESSIVVLVAYEKTAHEIINGKRPATAEQKMRATEFINGLKEFNEKQTPSWKLLDDNGRLINPKTATTNQRAAMQKSVSENGVLGREMNPTFESLTQGITRNLKRQ